MANPDARPHKLTLAWGDEQAKALFANTLARFDLPWRGATVLDFGCAWGYLVKFLAEKQRVGAAYGVDLHATWRQMAAQWQPQAREGTHLFAGDIRTIPEIQNVQFDLMVSMGTFMLIPPSALREILLWLQSHLKPGGQCVFRTRTFLSYCGGDLHRRLTTPLPHLLFSRRIIDAYFERRGQERSRYMSPMCAASYLTLYQRCGFEILEVIRVKNPVDEAVLERFSDKLGAYDPQELRTTEIITLLRRPAAVDTAELEGAA